MRRYKDLAVKDPRMGVFNLNGLRPDCKMDYWALARDLLVGKRNHRPSSPGPLTSPVRSKNANRGKNRRYSGVLVLGPEHYV